MYFFLVYLNSIFTDTISMADYIQERNRLIFLFRWVIANNIERMFIKKT